MKIFIVTPGLQVITKWIREEDKNSQVFLIRDSMGIFLRLVQWNGWSRFTEYGAFETKKEAEDFVEFVGELRKEDKKKGQKTIPGSEPDWGPIFPIIEKVVSQKEVLYIEIPEVEWIRLSNGGLDDIKKNLSEEAAQMLILQSPEYPEKYYQLTVCHHCMHHC